MKLQPGLSNYFANWFDQQRKVWADAGQELDEELVNACLLVLACALGPIKLSEFSTIVRRLVSKNSLISKQSLEPIGRFVVGDGIASGYAFAHPRLGIFIQEDYFGKSDPVDDTRNIIVEWGRSIVSQLNDATMPPEKAPEYALLYYSQHLEQLRSQIGLDRYRALVEDGWRKAWLSHPEGLRGFARDVQLVSDRLSEAGRARPEALKSPQTGLGGIVHCELCLSSIRSMGTAFPPNFMAELVRQKSISVKQALHFSRMKVPQDQIIALRALGPYLDTDFDEALGDARSLCRQRDRAIAVAELSAWAPSPLQDELLSEAGETSAQIEDEADRNYAIHTVKRIKDSRAAATVDAKAASTPEITERPEPWAAPRTTYWKPPVVLTSPAWSRMNEELTEILRAPYLSSYRLEELLPELPEDLLARALYAVLRNTDSYAKPIALRVLISYLPEDLQSEAFEAFIKQCDPYGVASNLEHLVPRLSEPLYNRLLERSLEESTEFSHYKLIEALAPTLSSDRRDRAIQAVIAWKQGYGREKALTALVTYLSPDQVPHAFEVMLRLDSNYRAEPLLKLLPILSAEMRDKGIQNLRTAGEYPLRTALAEAGPTLSPELLNVLAEGFADIPLVLDSLLPLLPEADRTAIVANTYKSGLRLFDEVALVAALSALACRLPEGSARESAEMAKSVARRIEKPEAQAFALLFVTYLEVIPEVERKDILEEIVRKSKVMSDEELGLLSRSLLAVSPVAGDVERREILLSLVPAIQENTEQISTLCCLCLLLSTPPLTFPQKSALFQKFFDKRGSKATQAYGLLFASMIPDVPKSDARSYISDALMLFESESEKAMARYLAFLSPAALPGEAEAYLKQSGYASIADLEERRFCAALLAPYLPRPLAIDALFTVLDNELSRLGLFALISVLEGGWLARLGIHPALGGEETPVNVLELLGGPQATSEVFSSICAVMQWWP